MDGGNVTLSWNVNIDWPSTGTFTDERGRLTRLSTRRGRNSTYTPSGKTSMFMGEAWLELENYDKRYDPYYASGPLFGNLASGKFVQIKANDTGLSVPVFTGYIADIRPQGTSSQKVIMRLVDGSRYLSRQKCTALATQINIAVSEAINDLLNMSSWPLVTSVSTFPLTFPITLGAQAIINNGDTIDSFTPDTSQYIWDAINDIAEAFLGSVFISRDGSLTFIPRNYARQFPYAQITEADLADADIEQDMPWDNIWNDLRITPTAGGEQTGTDAASSAAFGPSTFEITGNDFIQSAAQAGNIVDSLILYLPEIKRGLRTRIAADSTKQFTPELLNSVNVNISALGINNYYTFGAIQHDWSAGGDCITTFVLEADYFEVSGLQTFPLTFPISLLGGW